MLSKLLPEEYRDLIEDEKRAFAFLATVMEDGSPQVTPVWFNSDGENILMNSARGRVKDLNMSARPEVSMAIVDPQDPYRYIQVRGTVVDYSEEAGDEHINALAKKYTGNEVYPWKSPGEVRVRYTIRPKSVSS
jgi:PPOX class probable F420-dependent enzyme